MQVGAYKAVLVSQAILGPWKASNCVGNNNKDNEVAMNHNILKESLLSLYKMLICNIT